MVLVCPRYLISIHALHTEGDTRAVRKGGFFTPFQSTPSIRRATLPRSSKSACVRFQSTPSIRRAT